MPGRDSIVTRSAPATARSSRPGAGPRSWPGRRTASRSPRSQARVRPALGGILARLAEGRPPGTHDRSQVAGYGEPPAAHPWSIVVGHDGVFKVALLTLFDLPLERFWMWSMDLCAITIVEFRAGRPVLRAHNLTAHLGALDEESVAAAARAAAAVDRERSGAQ